MVKVEKLSYKYNNGFKVLDNINLTIQSGEFIAFIGQNGSGKTTFLKHLNGLLKATDGKITICGMDCSQIKTSVLAGKIGFLFQNPDHQIFCNTVFEEIAFGLKNLKKSQEEIEDLVQKAANKVRVQKYLDKEPFSLSKGQRQRVALASVLAMETDIVVLDEPTTGQDYSEGLEIMEIVKELNKEGKTIVMVTHDMDLVSLYAKRVVILKNGSILADGPTEEVLQNEGLMALSNLMPPQMYLLSKKFHRIGFFKHSYSVEDMYVEIMSYLEGEQYAGNG